MDYSAVGQTTHLAARMEQLATPGTILVTEAFARLTEGYLHFKPLGLAQIKGLTEAVDVLRARGRRADPRPISGRRARAHALRGPAGRARAISPGRWSGRARGHGQAVAVIGEPGVGKSRLFYEFVDSPSRAGLARPGDGLGVLREGSGLSAAPRAAEAYFQIQDRDERCRDPGQGSGKAGTRSIRPSSPCIPALLALLDRRRRGSRVAGARSRKPPAGDARWREAPSPGAKPRGAAAPDLREPALDRSGNPGIPGQPHRQPADGADHPVRELPAGVSARVGQQDVLQSAPARPVAFRAAPTSCSMRCSATTAELRPLKKLLIERTEGNPFFLEESVRTLVETKMLLGRAGRPPSRGSRCRTSRCRPPCRASWPRGSIACPRKTSTAPDARRSSARTSPSRSSGHPGAPGG